MISRVIISVFRQLLGRISTAFVPFCIPSMWPDMATGLRPVSTKSAQLCRSRPLNLCTLSSATSTHTSLTRPLLRSFRPIVLRTAASASSRTSLSLSSGGSMPHFRTRFPLSLSYRPADNDQTPCGSSSSRALRKGPKSVMRPLPHCQRPRILAIPRSWNAASSANISASRNRGHCRRKTNRCPAAMLERSDGSSSMPFSRL